MYTQTIIFMRSTCVCIIDYFQYPEHYYYNPTGVKPIFYKDKIYEYTDQQFVSREYTKGFNVQFHSGQYIYFRKYTDPLSDKDYGLFSKHFKTLKQIRKEKLEKLNKSNPENNI